jgi:hypothetical protein
VQFLLWVIVLAVALMRAPDATAVTGRRGALVVRSTCAPTGRKIAPMIVTPATAAGVTDRALEVSDLVALMFAVKPSSDHEREIARRWPQPGLGSALSLLPSRGLSSAPVVRSVSTTAVLSNGGTKKRI